MSWKPITEQWVVAHVDGKVRQLLVTAFDSYSGSIRVGWPPQDPSAVSLGRHSRPRERLIEKSAYEPLNPNAFKIATTG